MSYDATNKRWSTPINDMKTSTSRNIDFILSNMWKPSKSAKINDEGVMFSYTNFIYLYTANNTTHNGILNYVLEKVKEESITLPNINLNSTKNYISIDTNTSPSNVELEIIK